MSIRKPAYKRIFKGLLDESEKVDFANSEWNDLKKFLEDLGAWNTRTAKIADRLVREYVEYEFTYSAVMAVGAIGVGSKGGDLWNLRWSALEKTKNQILKLEEALRIPPQKAPEKKQEQKKKTASDEFLA